MSHSLSDGWGSRSASGTWDEIADAQQKELANLVRVSHSFHSVGIADNSSNRGWSLSGEATPGVRAVGRIASLGNWRDQASFAAI